MIMSLASADQATATRGMPCMAVDLGFSRTSRSCGFASCDGQELLSPVKRTFRDAWMTCRLTFDAMATAC
jgi:hypothetical protein